MNILRRMRATWYPDEFHGWGHTRRYFEGWYFKVVSADEQHALAFIPGISYAEDGSSHAFIQVMDGKQCKAYYYRFAAADFMPAVGKFEVRIGGNLFSKEKIVLDLPDFKGEIRFENTVDWPKMFGAPGIMGWYSFVPFMECSHGVVSLNHQLQGAIRYGAHTQDIVFNGGKGYIEKDWGRSFPRAYVWMQSNHFDTWDRASLLASVAHIPWLGNYFIGFISGFWLEGTLFRFATYTGAKKRLLIGQGQVDLVFKSPKLELRLLARQAQGTALISPISGEMTGKVNESLLSTIQVELLQNGRRIFEGTGSSAGLEVAGDYEIIAEQV